MTRVAEPDRLPALVIDGRTLIDPEAVEAALLDRARKIPIDPNDNDEDGGDHDDLE